MTPRPTTAQARTKPRNSSSPAAACALPEPTDEQLFLAFRHLARPGWPATLEAAMQRPGYSTAIRALARNLHRGAWRATPATPAAHAAPPAAPPAPAATTAQRRASRARFDPKRAAANDRDD